MSRWETIAVGSIWMTAYALTGGQGGRGIAGGAGGVRLGGLEGEDEEGRERRHWKDLYHPGLKLKRNHLHHRNMKKRALRMLQSKQRKVDCGELGKGFASDVVAVCC